MPKFSVGDTVRVKGFTEDCQIRVVHEAYNTGQRYSFVVDGRMNEHTSYEEHIKLISRKGEVAKSLCNKCNMLPCTCIPAPTLGVAFDSVNHPKHYTSHPSGVECIEITEHMGFNLGNALKYIWRADLKADAIEDMEKAVWYLQRELAKRGAAK